MRMGSHPGTRSDRRDCLLRQMAKADGGMAASSGARALSRHAALRVVGQLGRDSHALEDFYQRAGAPAASGRLRGAAAARAHLRWDCSPQPRFKRCNVAPIVWTPLLGGGSTLGPDRGWIGAKCLWCGRWQERLTGERPCARTCSVCKRAVSLGCSRRQTPAVAVVAPRGHPRFRLLMHYDMQRAKRTHQIIGKYTR
jgi:hypothetical protein